MNVLLIGSGGREHALAWKLAASPLLTKLYAAPGNPGIAERGRTASRSISPTTPPSPPSASEKAIDLVVVGPEGAAGRRPRRRSARRRHPGLRSVAGGRPARGLEGLHQGSVRALRHSDRRLRPLHRLPTRRKAYVRAQGAPIVVKADGLAAGKGVTVAMTLDEALAAIDACFDGAFGGAGAEVVVEEFLTGEEASFFCLCDGKTALPFGTAQDHKRVGDGDTGPNTGGMGAYSPAPVMTPEMVERTMREIIEPTMRGMAEMGAPFSGVLFAGLMITADGPKLIEYNVRFGDPECQVLMMRLKDDLLVLLNAAADGQLAHMSARWRDDAALTVVMAAQGLSRARRRRARRSAAWTKRAAEGVEIFHAGTALERTASSSPMAAACSTSRRRARRSPRRRQRPMRPSTASTGRRGFCRRDIGWRAVEREEGERRANYACDGTRTAERLPLKRIGRRRRSAACLPPRARRKWASEHFGEHNMPRSRPVGRAAFDAARHDNQKPARR